MGSRTEATEAHRSDTGQNQPQPLQHLHRKLPPVFGCGAQGRRLDAESDQKRIAVQTKDIDCFGVLYMKKAGICRLFSMRGRRVSAATSLRCRPFSLRRLFSHLRSIHQFNIRHRRIVALAEAAFENAEIAAVARGVTRAELVEYLDHDVTVAQAVEREPAVGEARLLAERDDGLDYAAQFFRLRQRGLDGFVAQQCIRHVAQHRQPVAAGAVELSQSQAVSHDGSLRSVAVRPY